MSIPVVEIAHESICNACVGGGICQFCSAKGCTKSCPACAVEKNNKAWAKYLVERWNGTTFEDVAEITTLYAIVAVPLGDFQNIKKLAEEKVDGK